MAKILNKIVPWYKISNTYIVDVGKDNAEERTLYEGIVTRIDVSSDGSMSFGFTLSDNVNKEISSDDLTLYEDVNGYKSDISAKTICKNNVAGLIKAIGIALDIFYIYQDESTGQQYLATRGFFINDNLMVEKIDFPDTLTFSRTVDAEGNVSQWKSNANFDGLVEGDVYASREDALKNHKTILKRFGGKEDLV